MSKWIDHIGKQLTHQLEKQPRWALLEELSGDYEFFQCRVLKKQKQIKPNCPLHAEQNSTYYMLVVLN